MYSKYVFHAFSIIAHKYKSEKNGIWVQRTLPYLEGPPKERVVESIEHVGHSTLTPLLVGVAEDLPDGREQGVRSSTRCMHRAVHQVLETLLLNELRQDTKFGGKLRIFCTVFPRKQIKGGRESL